MKFAVLTFFILQFTTFVKGQNLIPNPSFESINYCETIIPCSPSAWFSVSNIPYGYQNNLSKSIDGKHSIALLIAYEQEIRSYWQTMLLCDLKAGEKYVINFDLYSPDVKFDPQYIGVHLSDTLYHSKNDTLLWISESIKISDINLRSLKKRWFEIKISFVATGKEKYFLLGNFNQFANRKILQNSGTGLKFIEYYVDNISLKPESKFVSKCAEHQIRNDSLYGANIRHAHSAIKSNDSIISDRSINKISKADTIILGKINFKFDSEKLINTQTLKQYFNSTILPQINKIEIIGYTDSIGTKSYNLKLSERRAYSVKEYLINTLRIPAYLIFAAGRGVIKDSKPLENNRKVELIISRKQ